MRSEFSTFALAVSLLAGAQLAGCARTTADSSLVVREDLRADELEFFAQLDATPVVTNDDALHALFLFAIGEDPHDTYEQRVEAARLKGWLPLEDTPPANESVTVGTVAVALARITGIKGGVTMRLLGPTPRAATREMVYLEVLPDRTEWQAMSGAELVEVLGRAERLLVGSGPATLEESLRRAEESRLLEEPLRDVQQERQRTPR